MGFIIDSMIDWFWTGFVLKLRDKYPSWVWITAILSPLMLVALFFGGFYLTFR